MHSAKFVSFVLRHKVGISTAATVLVVDQIAKILIIHTLSVGESWPHDSPFRLTHATNTGDPLDLFSGHTTILVVTSVASIVVLAMFYWSRIRIGFRVQTTFGLMLAGCVSNLADRLILGHVVDFIDVLPWFIFNVADVSILIGLIGFLWDIPSTLRRRYREGTL